MFNDFYVYRHIRLDTNTPFYVGKGYGKRAYKDKLYHRNPYWHNIVDKHGYEVEIIFDNLTEEEAFTKEKEFIKLYKFLGYCEANMTDGGEGVSGLRFSEESLKKMSESHKGLEPSNKGKKGLWKNPIKGKTRSVEFKNKISKGRKGKKGFISNLNGFVEKYGIEEGYKKYIERKKKISETMKRNNSNNMKLEVL